jgi:rhodanese-related sulfurtransferase
MKKPLLVALGLALGGTAFAAPQVSGDGACGIRAIDNASFLSCEADRAPQAADDFDRAEPPPAIAVDAKRAWQIKQDLGARALLVDIRTRAEVLYAGMPIGADANVPLLDPAAPFAAEASPGDPALRFDPQFLLHMDELLRAARLRHADPVVLLCRSGEYSALAARLMQEHGYLQVFVVSDGFEGVLAANADGSEIHRAGGWKNAGLPWTARVDPRWVQPDRLAAAR